MAPALETGRVPYSRSGFSGARALMEKPYRSIVSMYHKESSLTTITIIENRNEVGLLGEWNDPASVEPYSYAGYAITSGITIV